MSASASERAARPRTASGATRPRQGAVCGERERQRAGRGPYVRQYSGVNSTSTGMISSRPTHIKSTINTFVGAENPR